VSAEPNGPDDSTQRELERRALRGVRGLVDKLDNMDQADRRSQRKLFWWIVGGALAAVLVLAGVVTYYSGKPSGGMIEIQAPRK
jgi:hypothetical protein